MILCAFDLETSGLDPKEDRICQVGFALYNVEFDQIVSSIESIVWGKNYPVPKAEALEANGLSLEFLNHVAGDVRGVFQTVIDAFSISDYIVAHNGIGFDKPFIENELERNGLAMPNIPFIDTQLHINYPKKCTSKRLQHLAVDHGVKHYKAHSALSDCLAMLDILKQYNIQEVIERSKSPMVKVIAEIAYEKNHLVKEKRFSWNQTNKRWEKKILLLDVESFIEACPFKVYVDGSQA